MPAQPQRPDYFAIASTICGGPVAKPSRRLLMDTGDVSIVFEVTPASIFLREDIPHVTIAGPDGEVGFVGLDELRQAAKAMAEAVARAERCAS